MNRTLTLAALLVAYGMALGGVPGVSRRSGAFDPLAPRPHAIEQLIVAKRFADALPLVTELRANAPNEPLVAFWLATVHQGLEQWPAAVDAWEAYLRLSPAPADACPALPLAYDRLGRKAQALSAYARCVQFDPRDPLPWLDLGSAYERAGRVNEALVSYQRAATIDPDNPVLRARIAARDR